MASIREFYKDKTVFITGATGFMGKVLLEKLLWSCPDIKQILVLIREKRGKSGAERVDEFSKLPLFDRIRSQKPELLLKVRPVIGDIRSVDLGLSNDDLQLVIDNTNIIFHMAATINFEAPLKTAIEMNVRGVQYVINIAKQMSDLKVMLHVSTTYCCSDQEVLEEKVYDFNVTPKDLLNCLDWMSDDAMNAIKAKIISPHPNTYCYTKRVAELLVRDEYENLPIVIARPSLVLQTLNEPFPGWSDTMNGWTGLIMGAGKGIVRSMILNADAHAEVIPVDLATNFLIAITWKYSLEEKPKTIPVYNVTCLEENRYKYRELFAILNDALAKFPFEAGLWCPELKLTSSPVFHYTKVFFTQMIPAYLVDGLCVVLGKKRFLVKLQKKIAMGLRAIEYIALRKWDFHTGNARGVISLINSEESKIFPLFFDDSMKTEFTTNMVNGVRLYLAKEPLSTLPKARKQLKILQGLDKVMSVAYWLFFGLVLKFIFKKYSQSY